jgi:tryptophan-rich hypothetical protein
MNAHNNSVYNAINPEKLLLSKWTAVNPKNKEKHFLISEIIRDEQENVVFCRIEAVLTGSIYQIKWQDLKEKSIWRLGWC